MNLKLSYKYKINIWTMFLFTAIILSLRETGMDLVMRMLKIKIYGFGLRKMILMIIKYHIKKYLRS